MTDGRTSDPELAPASEQYIPPNPNPEADRSPAGIATQVEKLIAGDTSIEPEALLAHLEQSSGDLVHTGDPAPDVRPATANPEVQPFDSGSSGSEPPLIPGPDMVAQPAAPKLSDQLEAQEEAPLPGQPQQPAQAPPPPTRELQVGEKTYSQDQIELALQLADRSTAIDGAYQQKMQQLAERERTLSERERTAGEGLALRDLAFTDPQRFRQLVESSTGRPLPGFQPPQQQQQTYADEYGYDEGSAPPGAAPESERQYLTIDQARQAFDQWGTQFRDQIRTETQQEDANRVFYGTIDRVADDIVRGAEEFKGVEERAVRAIGEAVGNDMRLGLLRAPDLPKGERGSSLEEVERAVKIHAQKELLAERERLGRWAARTVTDLQSISASMPAPARGAATILPGQDRRSDQNEVPGDIDGLIQQVSGLADAYLSAGRNPLGG
jgi:hypothetical protein